MDDLRDLRVFLFIAWIQLSTVMYGGYALLGMLNRGQPMSDFQRTYFRAGHAHAGVLLLMSLLYYIFLSQVDLSMPTKVAASVAVIAGALVPFCARGYSPSS